MAMDLCEIVEYWFPAGPHDHSCWERYERESQTATVVMKYDLIPAQIGLDVLRTNWVRCTGGSEPPRILVVRHDGAVVARYSRTVPCSSIGAVVPLELILVKHTYY